MIPILLMLTLGVTHAAEKVKKIYPSQQSLDFEGLTSRVS